MIDLLDCPFCGKHAIRTQHPGRNWWSIGCHCEMNPTTCWYTEKVWNRRPDVDLDNEICPTCGGTRMQIFPSIFHKRVKK